MRRAALCVLGAALLVAGCATRASYEAEVARQRALGVDLVACKQSALDMSKTREKLLLEKSSLDQERMELIAEIEAQRAGNEALERALEAEREAKSGKDAEIQQLAGTYQSLVDSLESELRAGEVEIEELRGRLQVRALEQILFASGSSELGAPGRALLAKVATQIAKVADHEVRVDGHTDNVPIATPRFASNWELSVARAATVARYLAEQGVPASRLAAAGYGENRPIADNASAAGRARNRRIEIVLVPILPP